MKDAVRAGFERTPLIEGEEIISRLGWRYAVKGFDPDRRVSERDWKLLEQAAILAPSSYGLQPFRIIVISDRDMKERLAPACYNQPQVRDCSHLVFFAARKEFTEQHIKEFLELTMEVRGTPAEDLSGLAEALENTRANLEKNGLTKAWAQRQTYISLGFLLETAALLGVDACPMEGFVPEQVDKILGLEEYTATVMCALGYRTGSDWLAPLKKVRFPADTIVTRI